MKMYKVVILNRMGKATTLWMPQDTTIQDLFSGQADQIVLFRDDSKTVEDKH